MQSPLGILPIVAVCYCIREFQGRSLLYDFERPTRWMRTIIYKIVLLHQQQHAHTHQRGGEPAAAVDVFMQQEFGQDGGTDIGKRR
jgi:hypothetical protein